MNSGAFSKINLPWGFSPSCWSVLRGNKISSLTVVNAGFKMREWKRKVVVVALCFFTSLIVERATVLSPTWWFGLQACPGQERAAVLMNHAAGNRSPAEVHRRGAKHCHKGLIHSKEALWRSCRLKQSIRDHSIIITPRESWCCAVHTLQHMPLPSIPPSTPFVKWLVWLWVSIPPSTSIIIFPPLLSSFPRLQFMPSSVVLHLPSILISLAVFSVAGRRLCTQIHVHIHRQMNMHMHHTTLQIVRRG